MAGRGNADHATDLRPRPGDVRSVLHRMGGHRSLRPAGRVRRAAQRRERVPRGGLALHVVHRPGRLRHGHRPRSHRPQAAGGDDAPARATAHPGQHDDGPGHAGVRRRPRDQQSQPPRLDQHPRAGRRLGRRGADPGRACAGARRLLAGGPRLHGDAQDRPHADRRHPRQRGADRQDHQRPERLRPAAREGRVGPLRRERGGPAGRAVAGPLDQSTHPPLSRRPGAGSARACGAMPSRSSKWS